MKEKILYLECYSGISGDMTVAALLDLGADQKVLMDGLNSLHVDGYKIVIGRRAKNSIDACDFNVVLTDDLTISEKQAFHGPSHEHNQPHVHDHNQDHNYNHSHDHDHNHDHNHNNDHDHDYNHDYDQDHNHDHDHDLNHDQIHNHDYDHDHNHDPNHDLDHDHDHNHYHDLNHDHDHIHDHDHDHIQDHSHDHNHTHNTIAAAYNAAPRLMLGHHEHRNLFDINVIIDQSDITVNAKTIAKKIFHIIAVAEAKAHAKSLEEVHFHEVGAIDSIVDIVAAAICLDNLNIKNVVVSELYEGTGQIKCQHGLLPIPVPAVVNIAAEHHLPLHITSVKGELVTPTGAGIVAAIRTMDVLPKEMTIQKIGLGAGKRSYENASGILRAMLIEDTTTEASFEPSSSVDKIWVLEANIDDCTGEALAYAMELLFQNGAKDVYYTPIYMKKNRPAYLLGVICGEEHITTLEGIIFTNTTTIGIRRHEAVRTKLDRVQKVVATPSGDALVKVCTYQNQNFFYPEYESIKTLCNETGHDYMTMYQLVQNLAKN